MHVDIPQKAGRSVRLYYELRGKSGAPPLLLIRGLARHLLHWGKLPELLEDDFRLVLFDNRGMGRSEVPRPPYTTARMADDAAEVLRAAGVERAHVFGMSLGGMIAQELALRHTTRVDRLVLGCTRAGPGTGPRIAPKTVLEMLGAGRFAPDEAIARTAHLALGERFISEHPEVIAEWRALARDYPPARAGFLGQLVAGGLHDTRRRLSRVAQPTLVITGDADNLIHADHSRYLAKRIRDAQLEVLPGAGHDFTTERPELAAQLLKAFLLPERAARSTAA
ncbi:MAG: alpha/beta fold hydrolase [Polyangiaceae bacterium]